MKRLTPTTVRSPDSIRRIRSAWLRDEPALELVDGLEGAAQREHVVELGLGAVDQLGGLGLDHVEPSKMSSYSSRSVS